MSLFKRITEKPWETKGVIGGLNPEGSFDAAPEKVALVIFLVVASVIFSMLTVSYYVRMELPDWTPLSDPAQLWLNTGLLVVSSILFQWARNLVSNGQGYSPCCLSPGNLWPGIACSRRAISSPPILRILSSTY